MKTEQEQIDEMVKVIKGFDICGLFERCFSTGANGENTRYITCPECFAEALYNAGYGDVSEYKAEIERLKAENCDLAKKLEARLTCDFVRTAQKQAQIDVLNKVKERAVGLPAIKTYHICNLIDELIKEVENEQKD